MAKAILYDATKCTACRGCQVACKQWNELKAEETTNRGTYENPRDLSGHTWNKIKFTEVENGGKIDWLFTRQACMHCTDASCEKVCPTGAISHQGEVVVIDQKWCIGCGYCVQACPFHVPQKDEEEGTARKCRFCLDRITNGGEPACVKTCPSGAMQFGERSDLITAAQRRVQLLRADGHPNASLYGEHELGGLNVIYVLADRPSVYGLPEAPRLATSTAVAKWLSGIITAGVVAAIPFWLLFKRKKQIKAEQESKVEGGTR